MNVQRTPDSVFTAYGTLARPVEYTIFQRDRKQWPNWWVQVIGGSYMGLDSFLSPEMRRMIPPHVGVIGINRPGYGESEEVWHREAVIDNTLAALEHAGIRHISCVLGMSSGAQYAPDLANALKADRMVLVSPIAPLVGADGRAIFDEMEPRRRQLIELARQSWWKFSVIDWLTSNFLASFPKRGYDAWANAFSKWDQAVLRSAAVRSFLQSDLATTAGGAGFAIELRHWLDWHEVRPPGDQFTGPVTIMMGHADTVSTSAMSLPWMRAYGSSASLHTIPGAGHYLWLGDNAHRIWAEAITPTRRRADHK